MQVATETHYWLTGFSKLRSELKLNRDYQLLLVTASSLMNAVFPVSVGHGDIDRWYCVVNYGWRIVSKSAN